MFTSGITPSMENPGQAMSRLHSQGNLSIKGVKGYPKLDKVSNAVRGFVDQYPYFLFIAYAISSSDCILKVTLGRIILADSGSNTPLGIFSIAVINAAFGYNKHTALLFCQQSSVKTGNTTANYNIVILVH